MSFWEFFGYSLPTSVSGVKNAWTKNDKYPEGLPFLVEVFFMQLYRHHDTRDIRDYAVVCIWSDQYIDSGASLFVCLFAIFL